MVALYMIFVFAVGVGSSFWHTIREGAQACFNSTPRTGQQHVDSVADASEGGGVEETEAGARRGLPISAEQYFLAGRDTPWYAVGLALFASNIGSEHRRQECLLVVHTWKSRRTARESAQEREVSAEQPLQRTYSSSVGSDYPR